MSDSFDPYYTWLGIPPEEQPADHYRLLGVRRFETNKDVIVNAADQRMVYVRTFQTGKRMKESQRLLNEISAAQLCLIDPVKKKAYDEQLQQKLDSAGSASAILPAMPAPTVSQATANLATTDTAAAAAKSAIRTAAPLRTATPLPPQAPSAVPLTPIVVSPPGQPGLPQAAAVAAIPPAEATNPAAAFAAGPSFSTSRSTRARASLSMSAAIVIGGGSFLLGAVVLAGVTWWALTRADSGEAARAQPVVPAARTSPSAKQPAPPQSPSPATENPTSAANQKAPANSARPNSAVTPNGALPGPPTSAEAEEAPASASRL